MFAFRRGDHAELAWLIAEAKLKNQLQSELRLPRRRHRAANQPRRRTNRPTRKHRRIRRREIRMVGHIKNLRPRLQAQMLPQRERLEQR